MKAKTVTMLVRIVSSLMIGFLPAVLLWCLLHAASRFLGVDLMNWSLTAVLNAQLAVLGTVGDDLKSRPLGPVLILWAGSAVFVYKKWSKRIAFFTVSSQDFSAMLPLVHQPDEAIVPFIEEAALPNPHNSGRQGLTAQRKATEALNAWVRQSTSDVRWSVFFPIHPHSRITPDWEPLSLALLTGPNGIGKSTLASHWARRLSWPYDTSVLPQNYDIRSTMKIRYRLTTSWLRTVVPWLRRRTKDLWDVGVLIPTDNVKLERLKEWEPRRPTILLIDEPDVSASRALNILEERSERFWHPVRVLLIDQTFPVPLDQYVSGSDNSNSNRVRLTYNNDLQLGPIHFDATVARAMWNALCRSNATHEKSARKRSSSAVSSKSTNIRYLETSEAELITDIAEGNPLQIALILDALSSTPKTVSQWYDVAKENAQIFPSELRELGLKGLPRNYSLLRHRLISARADDLLATFEAILGEEASDQRSAVMLAIAAATIAGGLRLPTYLAARLSARTLFAMFPAHSTEIQKECWIPPVRPSIVGRAFLERFVSSRVDPDACSNELASVAVTGNPEGSTRAMIEGTYLPEPLCRALQNTAATEEQSLFRAQLSCANLLCDDGNVDVFSSSLEVLSESQLSHFEKWLRVRLSIAHPRQPEPLSVLIGLSILGAERFARRAADLTALQVGEHITTMSYWARLAGNLNGFRRTRRMALAGELTRMLNAVPAETSGESEHWIWMRDLLAMTQGLGCEPHRASCRWIISRARFVRRGLGPPASRCAPRAGSSKCHTILWQLSAYGTSQLSGEQGWRFTSALARRVESIVESIDASADDVTLQEQRATVWQDAAFAASQLHGERAYELSKTLAEFVDSIAAAKQDFSEVVSLQALRVAAWGHVTSASGQLEGVRAINVSRTHAQHADAIASAHRAFDFDKRMQAQRIGAFQHAAEIASVLSGTWPLELTQTYAEAVEGFFSRNPELSRDPALQAQRAGVWQFAIFAACKSDDVRDLRMTEALARRVEALSLGSPEFADNVPMQLQRAGAWQHASRAVSNIADEASGAQTEAIAQRVEDIVNANVRFSGCAALQEQRVTAWNHVSHIWRRQGELKLEPLISSAEKIEALVTQRTDFACNVRLQAQRAIAWRCIAQLTSELSGDRARILTASFVRRIESIARAQPEFANDRLLTLARTSAWRALAFAILRSSEGTVERLAAVATHVEKILDESVQFAGDKDLQSNRAAIWQYATAAASRIGGVRALDECTLLAQRVDTIAVAHPEFGGHAGLQEHRAAAWCFVSIAALELDPEKALSLTQSFTARVESIATSRSTFLIHTGLQTSRAQAWLTVVFAATRLDDGQSQHIAKNAASKIWSIRVSNAGKNTSVFDSFWSQAQEAISEKGYGF